MICLCWGRLPVRKKAWEISCLVNNFGQYLLNLSQQELLSGLDCECPNSLPSRAVQLLLSFFPACGDHVPKQCDLSKCISSLRMPHFDKQSCYLLFKLYPCCTWSDNSEGSHNCTDFSYNDCRRQAFPCKYKVWFLTILPAELQNYLSLTIVLMSCQETSIPEMQTGHMQSWRKIFQYFL